MGPRCSVIGLGKLGACMGACLASRGIEVVGVDVRPELVDAVSSGRPPVFEPGLGELMGRHRRRLSATTDLRAAVQRSDVSFIVVPTPSDDDGAFSLEYVVDAARDIGRAMASKTGYHLVVLTSTVQPGSTEEVVRPELEASSGKTCGPDFGLCYSPEFIALGSVIRDFLHPEFVLIGESDPTAGDHLVALYARVYRADPPIVRTSPVNAELAKLAVNTFVTTKISFANMLAELCETLPGADVDEVTAAMGQDPRIGGAYLRGGLGYGGPCFPRDNLALSELARGRGVRQDLPVATDRYNRSIPGRLAEAVIGQLAPGDTVGVLGLSYKPGSVVVEESQGAALVERLSAMGVRVLAFDPILGDGHLSTVSGGMQLHPIDRVLREASVVVVANADPAFASLTPERFERRPLVLIDCWRRLRAAFEGIPGVRYIGLGLGSTAHVSDEFRGAHSEHAAERAG